MQQAKIQPGTLSTKLTSTRWPRASWRALYRARKFSVNSSFAERPHRSEVMSKTQPVRAQVMALSEVCGFVLCDQKGHTHGRRRGENDVRRVGSHHGDGVLTLRQLNFAIGVRRFAGVHEFRWLVGRDDLPGWNGRGGRINEKVQVTLAILRRNVCVHQTKTCHLDLDLDLRARQRRIGWRRRDPHARS